MQYILTKEDFHNMEAEIINMGFISIIPAIIAIVLSFVKIGRAHV